MLYHFFIKKKVFFRNGIILKSNLKFMSFFLLQSQKRSKTHLLIVLTKPFYVDNVYERFFY